MIVKNLLIVGVVAGFASAAAAADGEKANWGISGKIRMDAVQSTTDTKVGTADKTTEKKSYIMLKRAQFKLTGERGGDKMELKYYAESNVLDTATINHKFSDMVSATFGKMGVLAQSWENDYSSTDQYVWSMAGGMTPDNSTGAQVDLSFGDHWVSLQAVQGLTSWKADDGSTLNFANSGGLTAALQYRGEINKMIRPLITYTVVNPSSTNVSTVTAEDGTSSASTIQTGKTLQTHLGAGVQVEAAGAWIDVEMDNVTMHKNVKPEGGKDAKVSSLVLQAKYPVGASTPFFKWTSDTKKLGATSNVGDVKGSNMALGVEHKLDANCRLHAVWGKSSWETTTSATDKTKVDSSWMNLGVTAAM